MQPVTISLQNSLLDTFGSKPILIIILIIAIVWIVKNSQDKDWMEEAQRKNNTRFDYLNQNIIHDRDKRPKNTTPKDGKKWFSTGWVWNEETKLWDPPDYIHAEAKDKWEWDEEKAIWVDLDKKRRLERYQQFRREAGKGPTYEEWKAAREKDQSNSAPKP